MFWLGSKRGTDLRDRVEPTFPVRNDMASTVASSDSLRMGEIFNLIPNSSGQVVNAATAMKVAAVYAAVRLYAGAIATTSCSFYRKTPEGREKANDHDYWWLFNESPTPRYTASAFWEFVMWQVLLRGDCISYLVRPNKYSPAISEVVPVPRDNVNIVHVGSRLSYRITNTRADGTVGYFTADQDDVLHFPNFGFNGTCSPSVIATGAQLATGIAMAADDHAASTFGSGASVQYAVKAPKRMTQAQQEDFRESWVAKYGALKGHSKVPLILTEGLDVQELSMTAVDAQLLESRKYQVVDIARAFGIPPHMIGETSASTSWGSGIEQMSQGYVRYGLRPHLRRFAQELNRKLFPRIDRYFVEFNVDSLLEGDSKAQAEYFAKALGGPGTQGWMTINEVRALKNLPSVTDGETIIRASGVANNGQSDNDTEQTEPAPGA